MKSQLIAIVAAVLLVGCGNPEADKALRFAAKSSGNIEAVKQHLAAGTDVNAKIAEGYTPLDTAINYNQSEITALLRKHGGKTGEELKAEGK